jgi:hypothetical protein
MLMLELVSRTEEAGECQVAKVHLESTALSNLQKLAQSHQVSCQLPMSLVLGVHA